MSRRGERRASPGAIGFVATHTGKMQLGETEVAVHVLVNGMRVVEVTSIEAILGLPESGIGAFLAALPGTDRVRFLRKPDQRDPLADREAFGLPATKIPETLGAYVMAHPRTEAGKKAFKVLRALLVKGLEATGQNPEAADFLMAAATTTGRAE